MKHGELILIPSNLTLISTCNIQKLN
uniref:Uncharacterized protein n=1 Tax=Anguilla anguilla TaxID=7936 RepID=A0A0E9TUN9_ANGAN